MGGSFRREQGEYEDIWVAVVGGKRGGMRIFEWQFEDGEARGNEDIWEGVVGGLRGDRRIVGW